MNMFKKVIPQNITGVNVYLEGKRSRIYVGKLTFVTKNVKPIFYFEYDAQYLNYEKAIPVGPELPLIKLNYESETLFPSFNDRIPSQENAAYSEYCRSAGISETETNPLVLLSTIGKRGPSSFVFEPILKTDFSARDLKQYRLELGLSIRNFAMLFDLSTSHLQRIESNRYEGKKTLEQIKLLRNNLPALIKKIKENVKMHPNLKKDLIEKIAMRMKKNIVISAKLLQENQGLLENWQKTVIADSIIYCYAGKYAAAYELLNLIKDNKNTIDDMTSETNKIMDAQDTDLAIRKLVFDVQPFIMLIIERAFWQSEIRPDLILPCEIKIGVIYLAFSKEIVEDYFLSTRCMQDWEKRAAQEVERNVSSNPVIYKTIIIKKIENNIVQQQLNMGLIPLIKITPQDLDEKFYNIVDNIE